MVYINTLMIQKVLAQPHWHGRLTPRDYAALTPLIWEHVNPYGQFDLDMNARLALLVIEMAAGDTTVGSTPSAWNSPLTCSGAILSMWRAGTSKPSTTTELNEIEKLLKR